MYLQLSNLEAYSYRSFSLSMKSSMIKGNRLAKKELNLVRTS